MRHTNNGGVINVMVAVFPRIYKDASSCHTPRWREICTLIVLSRLEIGLVIVVA